MYRIGSAQIDGATAAAGQKQHLRCQLQPFLAQASAHQQLAPANEQLCQQLPDQGQPQRQLPPPRYHPEHEQLHSHREQTGLKQTQRLASPQPGTTGNAAAPHTHALAAAIPAHHHLRPPLHSAAAPAAQAAAMTGQMRSADCSGLATAAVGDCCADLLAAQAPRPVPAAQRGFAAAKPRPPQPPQSAALAAAAVVLAPAAESRQPQYVQQQQQQPPECSAAERPAGRQNIDQVGHAMLLDCAVIRAWLSAA